MRKPAQGDQINVPDSLTDEVYSGVVVDLLSVQFTYEQADGTIRYAFYYSDWRYQTQESRRANETTNA